MNSNWFQKEIYFDLFSNYQELKMTFFGELDFSSLHETLKFHYCTY